MLRPGILRSRPVSLTADPSMEILYLLIPLSVVLVFAIGALFWWGVDRGQFDDLEEQGAGILDDDDRAH